jgi:hypothetical protein
MSSKPVSGQRRVGRPGSDNYRFAFRRSSFLDDISEPNKASAALLKATIIWRWRDSYFRLVCLALVLVSHAQEAKPGIAMNRAGLEAALSFEVAPTSSGELFPEVVA